MNIIIRGDGKTKYRQIRAVLDVCQQANVPKVDLATEPLTKITCCRNTQPRKKRNSSKVNLIISFIFHAVLVVVLFYFAARQGLLGKQLQKISVEMVKEKKAGKTQGAGKAKSRTAQGCRNAQSRYQRPNRSRRPRRRRRLRRPPSRRPPPNCRRLTLTAARPSSPVPIRWRFTKAPSNTPSARNGTGRKTWTTTIMSPRWRSRWSRDGRISDPVWEKGSGNPALGRFGARGHRGRDQHGHVRRPRISRRSVIIRFDVQEETEPVLP